MKVEQVKAHQVRIPLKKAIRHASHTRTETENLVVRVVLEDGTVGFGEGVPREYVTGESIDSAMELLQVSNLSAQLQPCSRFEEAVGMIERIGLNPIPGDDRACQGNAARCALELALLDAFGKHFKSPLRTVTSLLTPELHEARDWVRYSGAITSARGFKLRLSAWAMRLFRFRQLKVKVGMEGYDDVARLRTIRKRVGAKMDLRLDANEAWSADEAAERIRDFEPFGITSVEQPVPHAQADRLGAIRSQVSTPIMLDESLCSLVDAELAVAENRCDLFNLRLSKCGGFIPSLRLAQFASRHGLACQLGCQVGETAILSAAGRHFASSVRGLRYLEGSYDRHLVREALGKKDISFRWGGWAPALNEPGLGIEIDPQALERVTTRTVTLL